MSPMSNATCKFKRHSPLLYWGIDAFSSSKQLHQVHSTHYKKIFPTSAVCQQEITFLFLSFSELLSPALDHWDPFSQQLTAAEQAKTSMRSFRRDMLERSSRAQCHCLKSHDQSTSLEKWGNFWRRAMENPVLTENPLSINWGLEHA